MPKKAICEGRRKKFVYHYRLKREFRRGGNNNLINKLYQCQSRSVKFVCIFCNRRLCNACKVKDRCGCQV